MNTAQALHEEYGLTRVLNARGTFTPLGVSRSAPAVAEAVRDALGEFFVIDELQATLSRALARHAGAEAAAATHCVAAAITLAVAAAMSGEDRAAVAALPDSRGLPNRVVIPAGHVVDYGHSILTDIRLAGATPVIVGDDTGCTIADLDAALAAADTACVLLVSSRLVRGAPLDLRAAVAAAHRRGVPAIIDAAAQDLRLRELLASDADLVLVSAHKYLAAPTAGLIVGRSRWVRACRAQEAGIGRAMKASKEALVGVLAALREREMIDIDAWRQAQQRKVQGFVSDVAEWVRRDALHGIAAREVADPAGMPFARAELQVDAALAGFDAAALAQRLRAGTPPVWLMDHDAGAGRLLLELVPLRADEIEQLLACLRVAARPLRAGRTDPGAHGTPPGAASRFDVANEAGP